MNMHRVLTLYVTDKITETKFNQLIEVDLGGYTMLMNQEQIKSCLIAAANRTKNVMMRDHIIPSQDLMIGEFVTSLRREFAYKEIDKDVKTFLCNKEVWDDVLVLKREIRAYPRDPMHFYRPYGSKLSRNAIEQLDVICTVAKTDVVSEYNSETIKISLERLTDEIGNHEGFVNKLAAINSEADSIMNEFDELFEKMSS